jgi:ankyrin repeat protein
MSKRMETLSRKRQRPNATLGRAQVLLLLAAASCWAAPDPKLVDAVKNRDTTTVSSLVNQHADVNAVLPDGTTPLSWAAYLGERQIAETLLAAGAKVNTADVYGETPLTLASANGDAALVDKVLKAGANANAARWDGETALMIAAGAGNADAVRDLLTHGADANAAGGSKKQTALMWAAAEGHAEAVQALIEHGANVNAVSAAGFTPLDFAVTKKDMQSVKSLLAAHADPNYALPSGTKVLMVAANYANTPAVSALLENGADVKTTNRAGQTALHIAAQEGNMEMLKMLLAKGADPNARTGKSAFGRATGGFRPVPGELTPLHYAARGGHIDAMKVLLAAGADPKLPGQDGTTLLMSAVSSAKVGVVQYAYTLDPNVDAVTDTGMTLIHASVTGTANGGTTEAQMAVCEVIQFLADKGAKLDERDKSGRTPIAIADRLPIDKAVDLLTVLITKSGATPKTPTLR